MTIRRKVIALVGAASLPARQPANKGPAHVPESLRASSPTRPFDPALKRLDEAGNVAVIGRNLCEALGVFERRGKLAGIAIIADEREQRVAIGRMARQILLESRHRLAGAPARMQRNGVDIGISR